MALLAALFALPCGDPSALGVEHQAYVAVATLEVLPREFEAVNAVLLRRAVDLSDHERRTVGRAICDEAERAGFDPFMILGVIDVESDFRRDVVSVADAHGLMQIQPVTLGWLILREGWAVSIDDVRADPALQVRLGVRYLKYLQDRFITLDAALMAYNMGPTKYGVVSLEEGGLDPYWGYARSVRRDTAHLKRLRQVPAASVANGDKPLATADGLWGG
ncbi:MAG: transglycosylase SLT domain-containing protein [Myxococcaceae bacterium]|nr:transglycosylase SLT domain-containing protein [Myxococcaceae bacterium]